MTQVTGKVVNRSQNGSRGATVRRSPRACPERELYNLRRKTPDCNFIPDNLIFVTDSIFFNVFLTMILTFLNIYFIFLFWLHRVFIVGCGFFVAACGIFLLRRTASSLQHVGFSLVVACGFSLSS